MTRLRIRGMRSTLLVCAVLAVAAVGCGDDEPADSSTTTGGDAPSPVTTDGAVDLPSTTVGEATTTVAPLDPVGTPSTDAVQTEGFPSGGGDVHLLTDVRVAGQEGFDRVVFDLDGSGDVAYRVQYIEPPVIEDARGEEVEVEGSAFLEVRITPASGFDLAAAEPVATYEGPDRVTDGTTSVVTEVVRTGDFEAMLSWVIGLPAEADFGVAWFDGRLIVDIVS